jgi:hypothetical protein
VDDLIQTLALSLGAGWASGINVYAVVLVLGLMAATGALELPAGLAILGDPLVLLVAAAMFLTEFVADKVPGVDSAWDAVHTFVRIPAGALLAAGAAGDAGIGAELAAGLLGGGLAAASHAAKSGTRVLINTSPEPFSNWAASVTEDIGVIGGLLIAVAHPAVFLVLLALFLVLLMWLLPKVWRGVRGVFRAIGRLFGRAPERPPAGAGSGRVMATGSGIEPEAEPDPEPDPEPERSAAAHPRNGPAGGGAV